MPELRLELRDHVAELIIDNPERRNALSPEMWIRLPELLAALEAEDDVLVLVVRGAGEHFSSGAEITALDRILFDPALPDGGLVSRGEDALAAFSKPVIAAIDGSCVGGGIGLAAACDLRIASDRARFAVPPAKLGILYPVGSLERLVALTGAAAAKRLLLTAESVDANEALRLGLVGEVVPAAELHARAHELAARMTRLSQSSLRAEKQIIALCGVDMAAARRADADWQAKAGALRDRAEGVAAFREGRPPEFATTEGDR
ncbi:enoyl-CoA hydratase/isomerase family protein [Gryllotalpicola koreensis]|uniref:Enoyl-CoA hydratase/isomerase family protein n=1 Tax=Gryllotalpicola koreensis TaxID=993086 RepID=A0ABP7ZYW8_9MICO